MRMEERQALIEEMFADGLALGERKGHDYSGEADALKNLKACEALGICTAEQGVLVRLLDKMCRLTELDKPGNEAQVMDESLADTEVDIAVYAALHRALRVEKIRQSDEVQH